MANPRAVAIANAARADLIDRVGVQRVLVGEPARAAVGLDKDSGEPIAVVKPHNAEQVVTTLKVGRSRHFDVIVRSNLPALDPLRLRDTIVLDTRGLDRPPAVDIGRRVVTVGAGVELAVIDRAARGARLCLRGVPAWSDGSTVGSLLAVGEPGEIGLGDGTLHADVVAATVVGGNGRVARIGGPLLIGQSPWACGGLPDPLALLLGGEGRMAVLIDVTLRLHPAPFASWIEADIGTDRAAFLAALSAARKATSRRLIDTVLVDPAGRLSVRSVTWRQDADLAVVTKQAKETFANHAIKLGKPQDEDRRARLGYEAGAWPRPVDSRRTSLDLHVSWPDAASVFDIIAALCAPEQTPATDVSWALGSDGIRVRCAFDGLASRHPLIKGVSHLLDAGAVPIGVGAELRDVARARMGTSSRVLTTALVRAFDPDNVLSGKIGVL